MKKTMTISALLLLIAGNAVAGVEYDKCIQEEKALKSEEITDCSGLSYMFNPSGCFATRKKLKEYISGKCKKIGITENVDFNVQAVTPEKKNGTAGGVSVKKTEPEVVQQKTAIEQLKAENARLKAEIGRLKTENEGLRKAAQ